MRSGEIELCQTDLLSLQSLLVCTNAEFPAKVDRQAKPLAGEPESTASLDGQYRTHIVPECDVSSSLWSAS